MKKEHTDYYFVFDLLENNYRGLLCGEDIYSLPEGYKAYKLSPEQLHHLDQILKKKINALTFIDKLKLLFGFYK